jgi:hypothetical protein
MNELTNNEPIDIYAYGRFSSEKQDKSIIIQKQVFEEACSNLIPQLFGGRKGKIVETYSDEGKSESRKRVTASSLSKDTEGRRHP